MRIALARLTPRPVLAAGSGHGGLGLGSPPDRVGRRTDHGKLPHGRFRGGRWPRGAGARTRGKPLAVYLDNPTTSNRRRWRGKAPAVRPAL